MASAARAAVLTAVTPEPRLLNRFNLMPVPFVATNGTGMVCAWCTLAPWRVSDAGAMTPATTIATGTDQPVDHAFGTHACSMLDAVSGKASAVTAWS
jgi:hypothetical protein